MQRNLKHWLLWFYGILWSFTHGLTITQKGGDRNILVTKLVELSSSGIQSWAKFVHVSCQGTVMFLITFEIVKKEVLNLE